MEWRDEGVVLSRRLLGERDLVVTLLTREHGRHAGVLRGSSRGQGWLEQGTEVAAEWRARLADHLGHWRLEPVTSHAAAHLDDPDRLAVLSSACSVAERALPERQPQPEVYDALVALFGALEGPVFAEAYVIWELGLLGVLGFGLELGECAATGSNDQLAYVSPRTGRAVSLAAGEPYKDKLLPLPGFLAGGATGSRDDIAAGLALTGHFIGRHVFAPANQPLPAARQRLFDRYADPSTISGR